ISIDTEISISSDNQIADMNIVIAYGENKITTSVGIKNGGIKFVGTMTDLSGKGSTGFVFLTAAFAGLTPANDFVSNSSESIQVSPATGSRTPMPAGIIQGPKSQ
ncbi:MAG: hypothetical protein ABIP97_01110, partial [Chthoniobacterales bacterium]